MCVVCLFLCVFVCLFVRVSFCVLCFVSVFCVCVLCLLLFVFVYVFMFVCLCFLSLVKKHLCFFFSKDMTRAFDKY